jgi:DNA-directed RNA polymerase subunit RPC12/RpoP
MPIREVNRDLPRPRRRTETYALACWRCRRSIEIAVHATPHRCSHCGASLMIQWRTGEQKERRYAI